MPKSKKSGSSIAEPPSKLDLLRQELAEVYKTLERLEQEVARETPPAPTRKSRIRPPAPRHAEGPEARVPQVETPAPRGMAVAASADNPPPVAPSPVVAAPVEARTPVPPPAAPPPPPPKPTGTDLSDPKNFGVLPPMADLEQGSLPAVEHRQKLARQLPYVRQILHTSGVRAEIWREWRAFEKIITQKLAEQVPVPIENP